MKMSEERFELAYEQGDWWAVRDGDITLWKEEVIGLLNKQQELIEELQVSDEMGWKRAEHFEKKCPKELHNKKMYIKRLEYKIQKFKEENKQLHYKIIELQDKLGMSEKVIDDE